MRQSIVRSIERLARTARGVRGENRVLCAKINREREASAFVALNFERNSEEGGGGGGGGDRRRRGFGNASNIVDVGLCGGSCGTLAAGGREGGRGSTRHRP